MSHFYLLSLVALATVPVMLLGYLWISEQHRSFEEQSSNWRATYMQIQRQMLRRHVDDIVSSLDFERETFDEHQREVLEQAVDNGMAQLDSLMHFAGRESHEQLLHRARSLLAPIRFGNGRDHFFIYTKAGKVLLLPAYPHWVGRDVGGLRDADGVAFAANMIRQVRNNGEAYLAAWSPRANGRRGALRTAQYLRYYAPLGIFLGAAAYADDMKQAVQREELVRLAREAEQEGMVLRIFDSRDTVLLDTLNPDLRGHHMSPREVVGSAMAGRFEKIVDGPRGGFLQMSRLPRSGVDAPRPMLVYLRAYPGWHWYIYAGYFLDSLEATINRQHAALHRDLERRVVEGALAVCALAVVAVLIAGALAQRTRRALQKFTDFFADASRNATSIDVGQLPYSEFEQLARDANAMVEQRSRVEQALRTSEQRFEMALTAAGSHLWDMNLRDRSIVISGSLFEQLGYSPEARQIDVAEFGEWVHPDDVSVLQRPGYGSDRFTREFRMRAHDGSYHWFLARGGGVDFDGSGKPLRALGTITDVSTRKQMEQELIAARIAAEDASHAKSQFLSSISHELRTPLNGVLGYAQILLRDSSASAEQRHNLHAIESCGQHLLTLIDDVLDLAKIESGKIELQYGSCDLYDLLESVSNIVRERVDVKGLGYHLEIATEVPATILIDEVKLRQILVNLLANAVKFTENGSITLTVSRRDEAALLFQVQDTGIGIPPERQQAIFEPFRQLGNTATGSGLGLPISQRLCEAMGGSLSVQSAVGTGSCFSFYLPLRAAVATHTVRALNAGYQMIDTGGQCVEVMVVDDNSINRQVLAGMLRAGGIEVCEAENGQDALDKLRLHPVPLVLMDVRMPVLDGFAATAAIKADPQLRDTIVIAVSASAFADVIERMRAHGCADFVGKPVRVGELLSKVAEHLQLPLLTLETPPAVVRTPAAELPAGVCSQLAAALALGDLEAMRVVLKPLYGLSPQLAELARHVERLLDDFDLDAVRELIAARDMGRDS